MQREAVSGLPAPHFLYLLLVIRAGAEAETNGIPQESVLDPMVFNIFPNHLDTAIEDALIRSADKTKLPSIANFEGQD